MTIQKMKQKKKELGYTNEMVSALSGVPLGTVQKVFAGATPHPRYETLQALEKAFKDEKYYSKSMGEEKVQYNADRVSEAVTAYQVKKQGKYTVDDYYALPDERRVELIDGVIYDMGAPTSIHQLIVTEIWKVLREYISEKAGECMPLASPIDVQLDCDNKTIVQPDVLVLCDTSRLSGNTIWGAPDFVVEVLSKSTRKKDMFVKLNKYMNAGVREYWMVDFDKMKVVVYDFAGENYPVIYGIHDVIPVGIFGGECQIDFGEIYDYLKSFSLVE